MFSSSFIGYISVRHRLVFFASTKVIKRIQKFGLSLLVLWIAALLCTSALIFLKLLVGPQLRYNKELLAVFKVVHQADIMVLKQALAREVGIEHFFCMIKQVSDKKIVVGGRIKQL